MERLLRSAVVLSAAIVLASCAGMVGSVGTDQTQGVAARTSLAGPVETPAGLG